MFITLNSLLGKLLISISLGNFSVFLLSLYLECITFFPYFVSLYVCFYELDKTAISPDLKGMDIHRRDLCVDCMCWVVLAGRLELKWVCVLPGVPWMTG